MEKKNEKKGKLGWAKRATQKIKEIRKAPIGEEVFKIVEDYKKSSEKAVKKIATPKLDLEN